MGWALAATQVVGGLVSAAGAAEQAGANATAARYQSAVARNNAAIARNNAELASRIGEQKAQQQEMKNRAQLGAIVAQQAANGVDVNTGSAKNVQQSAHDLGRQDTMTIRSDAAREAYGYQTEAQNFDTEAKLLKRQARQSRKAGGIGVFSSLLDSAVGAGTSYFNFGPTSGANVLVTE